MELSEIKEKLDTLDIPIAYMRFNKPQELPFAVYYEDGTEIKGADDYNLYRDVAITIELYAEKKSPALERSIEALFRDREIEKSPDVYLNDENMFLTTFSFNVIQYIEEE